MICLFCNQEFFGRKRKFCSYSCTKKGQLENAKEKRKKTYPKRTCIICKAEFIDNRGTKKYCSRKCRNKRNRKYKRYPGKRMICKICGKEFLNRRGSNRKACSRKCGFIYFAMVKAEKRKIFPKSKVVFVNCRQCGKLFTGKYKNGSLCSVECKRLFFNKQSAMRGRERYVFVPKEEKKCVICGRVFKTNKRQKTCSLGCSYKNNRLNKGINHLDRTEKYGGLYTPINPMRVFNRDGWRCKLCNRKLSPKDRGRTNKYAPELDHIIPLSIGGDHVYKNVQCACRECNGNKGNRALGQLLLFG